MATTMLGIYEAIWNVAGTTRASATSTLFGLALLIQVLVLSTANIQTMKHVGTKIESSMEMSLC